MSIVAKISNKMKSLPREVNLRSSSFFHRMGRKEEYQDIDRIMARHHAAGGLNNPVQPHKLWSLKTLLEKHQPKSIIEFGSGLSTFVFSEYAKKTGARVLSIDEEERWAENTRGLIQNPDVEVISKPRVLLLEKNPPEIKYDFQTDEIFDMAFIDGPNLKTDGKRHPAINSNVFDLKQLPKCIIIDGRSETAEKIGQMAEYDMHISDLISKKYVMANYNHLSVGVLKDK